MTFSVDKVRADFPVLSREVNGLPLAYLDSAASAQKPSQVIDAEARVLSSWLRGGASRYSYLKRPGDRENGERAQAGIAVY